MQFNFHLLFSLLFPGIGGGSKSDYKLLLAAGLASTTFLGAAVTYSRTPGFNEAIPVCGPRFLSLSNVFFPSQIC